jgi:hypothetical protein
MKKKGKARAVSMPREVFINALRECGTNSKPMTSNDAQHARSDFSDSLLLHQYRRAKSKCFGLIMGIIPTVAIGISSAPSLLIILTKEAVTRL